MRPSEMIVVEPLTRADAENTTIAWKQGRTKLDYPETANQRIVRITGISGFDHLFDFVIPKSITGGVLDAFRNYQIRPVPWSHRAEVVTELAA